jgi:hypothetical protein
MPSDCSALCVDSMLTEFFHRIRTAQRRTSDLMYVYLPRPLFSMGCRVRRPLEKRIMSNGRQFPKNN